MLAHQNLVNKKEHRQITLNNETNPIHVKIGDQVYITNENRRKLDPIYIGPFDIIEIQEPNCTIKNTATQKQMVVHENKISKA